MEMKINLTGFINLIKNSEESFDELMQKRLILRNIDIEIAVIMTI